MNSTRYHQISRLLMSLALLASACVCAAGDNSGSYSYGDTAGKNEACLNCHGDEQRAKGTSFIDKGRFNHTTHAKIGCVSCHGSVSATHPDGVKTPKADCGECHQDINKEYAGSLHAAKTNCSGCHNPHKVRTHQEISGHAINAMCSGCHESFEMIALHGEWLPQADLHMRMLPCITCHTESKDFFVSMYIVKGKNDSRFGRDEVVSHQELKALTGGGEIVSLLDTNGDNYISIEELRIFNQDPAHKNLRLQGMMTPETVTHKFEILDNRRNCSICHTSGSKVMQTSYLSIPEENGTFKRVAVEKGAVLDALYGTPDFYVMGSTKSANLNYFGLAIIGGGLIMPVGHGFLRFLTRKNREKKEHQS